MVWTSCYIGSKSGLVCHVLSMRNQREDMLMSMLMAMLIDMLMAMLMAMLKAMLMVMLTGMLIDVLMAMLIDTLKCDFLLFLFHDELHVFGVRTVRH